MELNITTPVNKENSNEKPAPGSVVAEKQEDLNKEYTDVRSVTISLIRNYSAFRKANVKVLGKKNETIGSCIRSSRMLASNRGEVEAYFPAIIGISPTNQDFVFRVKQYLNNIQTVVTDNDLKLNTTFIYRHKSDYLAVAAEEERINDKFEKADKANSENLKKAIEDKIVALNNLESTKYQYGSPQDVEQYLLYRHCLLYSDVAKDMGVVNSSPNVRFYIKDERKEKERQVKILRERNKAKANYIDAISNKSKFESIFIQYCVSENLPLTVNLIKDEMEKQLMLDSFATENPSKFNQLYTDRNIEVKAFIEKLIARGELRRSEFNQNITTPEGDFIGANVKEAVAYFNNPDNAEIKAAYEKKLAVL